MEQDVMSTVPDELKARIERLEKRNQQLEDQINPPPRPRSTWQPPDYTAGASMSPSAMRPMLDVVGDSLVAALRADARRPNPITGGPNPQPATQVQRGTGWQEPRPLESPPGVKLADRLVDAQDRLDLVERAATLAKGAALEAAAKEGGK